MTGWSAEALGRIDEAEELEIATQRTDGTLCRWVPIWVVRVGEEVYVRTWHRRDTGWFGHVLANPCARIRVPGFEVDVSVEDVGAGPGDLRAAVDAAYRSKYERYGAATIDRMTADHAVAATLRLAVTG